MMYNYFINYDFHENTFSFRDVSANAAIVSVASTIPLEDHLQDMNIVDRQIGLLVTTIIFSVLFFAVVVLVAIWFFLRW